MFNKLQIKPNTCLVSFFSLEEKICNQFKLSIHVPKFSFVDLNHQIINK